MAKTKKKSKTSSAGRAALVGGAEPEAETPQEKVARLEAENEGLKKRVASLEEDKEILKKFAAFSVREKT